MRRIILATCLLVSICAYHVKVSDVVLDKIEIVKTPTKYRFQPHYSLALEGLVTKVVQRAQESGAGTEAVLNDFADKIFFNVENLIVESGLDPLSLPEIHEGFNYTLIILYHGELDMTNGWLSDISTIHRGGDVLAHYDPDVKYLEITIPIAFSDMAFTFDYSAKIMGLGPTGYVDGKVTNLQVQIVVGFDSQGFFLSLDAFDVLNAGEIDLQFHGDTLLDWLLDLIALVATTVLKGLILDIVESGVRSGLDSIFTDINQAIDGFLNPTTPAPESIQSLYIS